MRKYVICNMPDEKLFYKQCNALEKNIPELVKGDLLIDVDGSITQIYYLSGKKIIVRNSEYLGTLEVESEIELEKFF